MAREGRALSRPTPPPAAAGRGQYRDWAVPLPAERAVGLLDGRIDTIPGEEIKDVIMG